MSWIKKQQLKQDIDKFTELLVQLTPEEACGCARLLGVSLARFDVVDGKIDKESVEIRDAEEIMIDTITMFGTLNKQKRAALLKKMMKKEE